MSLVDSNHFLDGQYPSVQLSQPGYPHMDEEGKKDVKAQLEYPDEELGIDRVQPTWGLLGKGFTSREFNVMVNDQTTIMIHFVSFCII